MYKLSKIKSISIVSLVFFVIQTFLPMVVLADDAPWYYGGQQIGSNVSVSTPPQNSQITQAAINGAPCEGDPVYLQTGEFYYSCEDLNIPGRGMDVVLRHTYHSGRSNNGSFGFGWNLSYSDKLRSLNSGNVVIINDEGRSDEYTLNGTQYNPPPGLYESLVSNPDGTWTLTKAHGEKYIFDINGSLAAIIDRNGNQLTFSYDPSGLLPIIGNSTFRKTMTGRIVIGYNYRLTRITDTLGRIINLAYNADGRLQSITDFTGRALNFYYDPANDNLTSIRSPLSSQYPAGLVKSFIYDTNSHHLKSIVDPKGQTFATNLYDSQGRVQEQTLGSAAMSFSYSTNSTTFTDRKGFITTYTFNATGNPTKVEQFTKGLRPSDPASFVTTSTFNADMQKTSVTFPKGNGIKYVYDDANANYRARGNLLEVRRKADMAQPDNDTNDIVARFTYEPDFNFIKTVIDPKGNVTTYIYDYELNHLDPRYGTGGNVVTITYPMVDGVTPTAELAYNQYGQVTEAADPNNLHTLYEYFPTTGYLKKITQDASGINATQQFTYDTFGNLDIVTDANNQVTNLDYNELGWLVKTTDALGQETLLSYDQNGNLAKSERKSDYRYPYPAKIFTYTIRNKIQTAADEVGNVTTFGYDANENLASMTDANNKATNYQYDERNLLWKVMDANTPAGTTEYAYDANANLAQIKDANFNATNYLFDLFDRQQKMTYADNNFSQYAYDKNSNLTEHLTPSNAPINYEYDELNRLSAKRYLLNASMDVTYGYDLGSRLTSVLSSLSSISYQYDNLNRVSATTQTLNALPYTLSYQYDKAGNRTQLTYPGGTVYNFTYDAINRMDLIKDASLNTLVDYDYNDENRMRSARKYGTKLTATYNYDYAQRLTSVVNSYYDHTVYPPNPNPAPAENISQNMPEKAWNYLLSLEKFLGVQEVYATNQPTGPYDVWNTRSKSVYTLDAVGNRLTNTTNAGLNTYSYNNIYELTGHQGPATSHQYAYDNVGNRLTTDSVNYTHNALNQYDHVGSNIFTYDFNGNLTDDGPGGYTYDVENRLITAQNTSHNSSYGYDGLGRRISKTVDGSTTYFIYSEDQIIEERASNGTLLASYLYGEGIDEVLMMKRGTTNYWYLQDGLGSVTDVVDVTGKTLYERYEYDPYGKPTIYNGSNQIIPASAIGNSFMFTGREFDSESGNYHYRARDYNPTIGRFLQRDPVGYYDSMNLYAYVNNNPLNWLDPIGLACKPTNDDNRKKPYWPIWFEPFIPGYGWYGGPMRQDSTNGEKPEDSMDELFQKHDNMWRAGQGDQADKDLYKELTNLPKNPKNWPRPPKNNFWANSYRKYIAEPYFRMRSGVLENKK